jgi:filamentous hemagglutinin family protein
MKTITLAVTVSLLSLVPVNSAMAQVAADGTLSTTISGGHNAVIEGGDRTGNNLFHSFSEFSVPTGGSAYFNNAIDVQNIFSRVTGSSLSNVDGLIRANGHANLFLLNPNGIVFGANARLNIGGSFIGSTANSLRFSDGVEFSAVNPAASQLLTVSVPIGLQFGQNPGVISVQGTGHRLSFSGSFFPADRSSNPTGLQVGAGHTIAFIGGEVNFSGGIAAVNGGGHLEIGSVRNGLVKLNATELGWSGDYSAVPQFSDIHLAQQSLLDASGSNGSILLQGRNISLTDGSAALIQNFGAQPFGGITINSTETLSLTGSTPDGRLGSLLQVDNLGAGVTEGTKISAAQLFFSNGGASSNRSFSPVSGGNVIVNVTGLIDIDGAAPANPLGVSSISTGTYNSSNAGDVTVSTGSLNIRNGGSLASLTVGSGQTGTVRVNAADLIDISGNNPLTLLPTTLVTTTFGSGQANSLVLNTSRLILREGGIIGSGTYVMAAAGDVTINASESLEVRGRGAGSITASRIASTAEVLDPATQAAFGLPSIPSGDAGSLIINTPLVRIADGASVTVKNDGPGRAGDLRINADSVFLNTQGSITASTASGNGGNIRLNLQDNLRMNHGSFLASNAAGTGNGGQINLNVDRLDLLGNSRITTESTGSGDAGVLQLRVGALRLRRGSIQAESLGTGNAGRLTINADSAQLNDRSLINASTQVGQGGDIQFQVRSRLELNDQSQIVADAQQSGRSGNVRINAAEAVLSDRSRISTNAQGSAIGGALRLEGDRLSLLSGSQITASTTGSGRAGNLRIIANDGIILNGRNTRLEAESTTDAAAGSILLQSPVVTVSDRASIAVSGRGQGGAGNLTVQANQINLENSTLEAEAAGGDRGNITLNAGVLSLRQGSQITTNATGTASGGNINLNTDFVIGFENSDILARAEQGAGGQIAIDAQGLLGIAPRSELSPKSDINASSQLGLNGTVNLSNPIIKPESGLIELPEEVMDSSQQIAQTCATHSTSSFVSTGRGGIPESPVQAVRSGHVWSDLRDLSAMSQASSNRESVLSSALLEATTWRYNTGGQLELIAMTMPQVIPPATCAGH